VLQIKLLFVEMGQNRGFEDIARIGAFGELRILDEKKALGRGTQVPFGGAIYLLLNSSERRSLPFR
jgi:hypothetical protein